MVIIEPAGMKNQDGGEIWHIRLGFETVSWQHAAHIQKRSYSIHAEPFSRTPKSSKQKKGSASRVRTCLFSFKTSCDSRKIHCLTGEFHSKFHFKNQYCAHRFVIHAKSIFLREIYRGIYQLGNGFFYPRRKRRK